MTAKSKAALKHADLSFLIQALDHTGAQGAAS